MLTQALSLGACPKQAYLWAQLHVEMQPAEGSLWGYPWTAMLTTHGSLEDTNSYPSVTLSVLPPGTLLWVSEQGLLPPSCFPSTFLDNYTWLPFRQQEGGPCRRPFWLGLTADPVPEAPHKTCTSLTGCSLAWLQALPGQCPSSPGDHPDDSWLEGQLPQAWKHTDPGFLRARGRDLPPDTATQLPALPKHITSARCPAGSQDSQSSFRPAMWLCSKNNGLFGNTVLNYYRFIQMDSY